MRLWAGVCLFWFSVGGVMGLFIFQKKTEPRPFPPGYGRSPVYYFEPIPANEYRFDI